MIGWRLVKEELLGPLALLCGVAISPLGLPIAAVGFILSFCFGMRGFAYGLILLGISAFFNHGFLNSDHLWQFGLEVSLACSLWITAMAQEERGAQSQAFESQLEANRATLCNLEEELNKNREERTALQIASDSKSSFLESRIEETEKEQASLQILNEVLRKTAAYHIEEKNELEKSSIDLQRKISWMREEINRYEKSRPPRDLLMQELNRARVEREQVHLINETLAKLHAQKCQELEQLRSAPGVEIPRGATEVDLLYRQLRNQFEEKNEVLKQTRQQLFLKETQLEAIQIEQEEKRVESDPLMEPIQKEMEKYAQETAILEEENQLLQQLITHLFAQSPPPARKKKAKRPTPQDLALFVI